ncbi:MAG TPA: cyclic nucleotide-binding domain-containing protein [Candidatus Limnocylindrales bacterium]
MAITRPNALARLDDLATPAEFATGAVILRDAAPVPFLGLVESGRVGVRLRVPGRGTVTVVTIEPGEIVGWSAVVPPFRATAEAVAVEPTRVRTYDAVAVRERLAADPALASRLLPLLLAAVSDRLTTSWQQLLDLFRSEASEPW